MVSLTLMYRRPKSLEVLLDIRTAMSEEAGYDVQTFVEMIRTGVRPADRPQIVTRVDSEIRDDAKSVANAEAPKVRVADE
ncbi:MAG: hypothetical protein JO314_00940 [Acidobacteria bacterium]|nr:hypothetical protein [Acidobacteriota bacterium]